MGSPILSQPKPKTNRVCFQSDFRNPNKKLQRKPYPMLKINEILLKLEGLQFATSLDLKMGYYHIRFSDNTSNLCTIILFWGNIIKNIYQWELPIHQNVSNRKWKIYFMDLNLPVCTWKTVCY